MVDDMKANETEATGSFLSPWSEKRLVAFWLAMKEIYGQRWIEEYGSEPGPAWRSSLGSMTPQEAGLGWRACRDSGDVHPVTLPVFLRRVSEAIKARKKPEIHRALPRPESDEAPKHLEEAKSGARTQASSVDTERLARALGVSERKITTHWPRRTVLRSEVHPAGAFTFANLQKARGEAKRAGRSFWDMQLELMAYNGWSPDDEERLMGALAACRMSSSLDSGSKPFVEAWRLCESRDGGYSARGGEAGWH